MLRTPADKSQRDNGEALNTPSQHWFEYIRNKIMNEEAKGDDALPPYEERFKATEDKVIDCLSQLNQ